MKENLLVLTGPTGIGKTNLSIRLANHYNSEIISADSMQIYKYMNIGTAKIKDSEKEGIRHHLIDMVKPNEDFTVSDYARQAKKIVSELNNKSKLAILVGGTGLYINSLVYDLNFASVPPQEDLRASYENIAKEKGKDYLYNLLKSIDEESASKIELSDLKRVIRALEIYDVTGKTMSEYNKDFRKENKDYKLLMLCLNMDRAKLYERINLRVDRMIEEGLIQEVKDILDMGYKKELVSLQAIGYKEIIMYLEGHIGLDRAIEIIKQGSRNYAKRQLTWFRRDKRFKWINLDDFNNIDDLTGYTQNLIDKKFYLNDNLT